jgi:hypothetical protein
MSDEKRINIEDLPAAEKELSPDEAKDVKGGAGIEMNSWLESAQAGQMSPTTDTKTSLKTPTK